MVATGLESSYLVIYLIILVGDMIMFTRPFHWVVNFAWGTFGFMISGLFFSLPDVLPFYPYLPIFLGIFSGIVYYVAICSYKRG